MTTSEKDWWRDHGQEIVATMASPNGPDIVALLHDKTSYGVYGDHGGAQESVQRVPMVFWSLSLAFGATTGRPFHTTDVMPTILATMGIPLSEPVDGTARRLGKEEIEPGRRVTARRPLRRSPLSRGARTAGGDEPRRHTLPGCRRSGSGSDTGSPPAVAPSGRGACAAHAIGGTRQVRRAAVDPAVSASSSTTSNVCDQLPRDTVASPAARRLRTQFVTPNDAWR